jgi:hypothetical protein
MGSIEDARNLARQGRTDEALRLLDATFDPSSRGDHFERALLYESLGAFRRALRELHLAARDEPNRPEILRRLADAAAEQGDSRTELAALERLAALTGHDPALARRIQTLRNPIPEDPPAAPHRPALPPVSDELVARMLALFCGREDFYARQWFADGRTAYTPVHEPLTPQALRHHLAGEQTLGIYLIRLDSTVALFVLDLDIKKAAMESARSDPDLARALRARVHSEGIRLRSALEELGFDPLFVDSGYKGRHLWVFLESPIPAESVHGFGRELVRLLSVNTPPELQIEFFPKQSGRSTAKGLGNLVKLPLGIHLRTGRRSSILGPDGSPLEDPLPRLRDIRRASRDEFWRAVDAVRARLPQVPASPQPARDQPGNASPPGPPPPPPAPPWTEADWDQNAPIRHLLAHCPVLARLKQKAVEERRLDHDEQLVLCHTLGHLPAGPPAVNWLFARCSDIARSRWMKSPHSGNPMSCPKIRQRIPHVTSKVDCNCAFEFAPEHYPTPLLHLRTLRVGEASPPAETATQAQTPQQIAQRYATLRRRAFEIQDELRRLEEAFVAVLRRAPDRTLAVEGGRWVLVEEQGVEEIRWEDASR